MALACLSVLGGLWYMLEGGPRHPVVASQPAISSAAPATENASPANAPSDSPAPAASPAGDAEGSTMNSPADTRGEVVADDVVVGQTSVPLLGIAVDSETPVTAAELHRAQRRQTMAAMSGKLGHAAAQMSAGAVTPASLIPVETVAADQSAETKAFGGQLGGQLGGMSKSSALDLPPASVGPLSLRLAAANGDPSAEFDVGARLAEGKGGEGDFKQAGQVVSALRRQGFRAVPVSPGHPVRARSRPQSRPREGNRLV